MTNRKFHFVRNANASVTTAECGVGIHTKRDDNWSEDPKGVSCKKCLAKMKKTQDAQQVSEPKKSETKKDKKKKGKRVLDKKAIKFLKKLRRNTERLHNRLSINEVLVAPEDYDERMKQVDGLLEIVEAMLAQEKDGWREQ